MAQHLVVVSLDKILLLEATLDRLRTIHRGMEERLAAETRDMRDTAYARAEIAMLESEINVLADVVQCGRFERGKLAP